MGNLTGHIKARGNQAIKQLGKLLFPNTVLCRLVCFPPKAEIKGTEGINVESILSSHSPQGGMKGRLRVMCIMLVQGHLEHLYPSTLSPRFGRTHRRQMEFQINVGLCVDDSTQWT